MVEQVQSAPVADSALEDRLRAYLAVVDLDRELVELTEPSAAPGTWRWELSSSSPREDAPAPRAKEGVGKGTQGSGPNVGGDGVAGAEGGDLDDGDGLDPGSVAGGLDAGVVRSVWSGLVALGLPGQAAQQVLSVAVGIGAGESGEASGGDASGSNGGSVRDQRLVDGVAATMLLARFSDAAMLAMVRDLALSAGQTLLARRGMAGVEELSTAGQVQWRAQTKSAVAAELQALNGWGIQSCHDRVAVALAPGGVGQRAQWALAHGWVDLRGVLDFWRRARNLPVQDAAVVAKQTLGPVPDGDGVPVRASREQFTARLHRAVTAAEGCDAAAARARRRAAVAARDATAVLDDDGTATFTVTGGTAPVAAAMLRVDSVARRARHQGEQRTLAQLRADLALALLVHGTLPDDAAHDTDNDRVHHEKNVHADAEVGGRGRPGARSRAGRDNTDGRIRRSGRG